MNIITTLAVLAATIRLSQAASFDFTTTLSGDQEVPSNTSTRTGTGTATYDSATRLLTVSGTFTAPAFDVPETGGGGGGFGSGGGLIGLASIYTSAHVHRGTSGVTGDVVFGLTFDSALSGSFNGSGVLVESDETALFASGLYINFHNGIYPDGEIRGQLVPVPEPETYATLAGLGLIGFGLWRRRATRA